ncbi:MAG: DUF3494 domain-containing protein [Flavobacterium sp.]|nr:DUF3494 domain-containing protein [Flavobacterium sp.]
MKTKLLFYFTTVTMMFTGFIANSQAPVLGSSANFVLFSSNGAVSCNVTNSLMTHLTGNVGTNTSGATSTGFGNVNGVMQDNNLASSQAAADLQIAYNQINSLIPNYFPSSQLGNGNTLNPGVYSINSAAVLNGNLILDGQNNPNSVFVFKIQGSFSTNSLSQITLINGALACNVFWKTEGLVDMSSGTKMKGTIVAHNAAILMDVNSTLEGRLLSTTGAITVNGINGRIPQGCGSPTLTGPVAPNLASTVCYAIFSGVDDVTNSGVTNVTGDIGTNVGLTTGYNSMNVNGTIHPIPDNSTAQCAADLLNVRTYLNALPQDIQLLYPAQFGNDLLLTPHTYLLSGGTVLTNSLFLDAQNYANAVFVIKIYGALSTSTFANVVLLNGAQAKNIYWIVNGAVAINDYSQIKGTVVCNNGAINVGTGANVEGRVLTTNGALTTSAITDNITAGCTILTTNSVVNKNNISIYPNPFKDVFTIDVNDENNNSMFSVYDLLGKIVFEQNINQNSTQVNLNLQSGLYIYKLVNKNGLIQTGKIISE